MTWTMLAEQAPELAAYGESRLAAPGVAYLATVDPRGDPRVHPVTPFLALGRLFVFMEPTSPKGHDLERGSRYALHCAVENSQGGGGEFVVTGSGRRIDDPETRTHAAEACPYDPADRYVLFELLTDRASSTTYDADGTPVRRRWRATT